MELNSYIEEIKLNLTGGVLELEISDDVIARTINSALREVQRYIDTTRLITVPYKNCIDLTNYKVSSVSRVFRTTGYGITNTAETNKETDSFNIDPMQAQMWQFMSGAGNYNSTYNIQNWALNVAAYNTTLQIANTLSTDLIFRFDKSTNYLYINCPTNIPQNITVEYVPEYQDVSEIKSDFWIDVLLKMSLALVKITIGRIRKKFTQSNALWSLDTDILTEGTEELAALREQLKASTQLSYGID